MEKLYEQFKQLSLQDKDKVLEKVKSFYHYINEYYNNEIYECGICHKKFYIGEAERKFEIWTQRVCTNPYSGYLDRYEYKNEEYHDYRYYCPHCNKLLLNQNHYKTMLYDKERGEKK